MLRFICIATAFLFLAGCESGRARPTDAGAQSLLNKKPVEGGESAKAETKSDTPGTVPVSPNANGIPTLGASLFDGFEGPDHTVWAFDGADDEGDASYSGENITQGQKALRVGLRGKGRKGKMLLRRDVEIDLSQASALIIDVHSTSDKVSVALALKCRPNDIYQEAKPVSLKKGLNKDLRLALDGKDWKNAETKWEHSGPPVNADKVFRVMLLVFTNNEDKGAFTFDNLRVEGAAFSKPGDAAQTFREWRPEMLMAPRMPDAVNQYEPVEVKLAFRASYRDVFDANDIATGMRVTTPSGKSLEVRGFFAGLYKYDGPMPMSSDGGALSPMFGPFKKKKKDAKPEEVEKPRENKPQGLPVWLLRFTPQETGRYTVQLFVRNSAGEIRLQERSLVVAPEAKSGEFPGREGGNVRVSARDPRMLERSDGAPFYIFGQNVCWSQDWPPYLQKIQAYGGNTCRIWLCPWGLNLERKEEPGTYDLQEAARIDELMESAEKTGVRIIFCFTFHGMTQSEWYQSPYNTANGGPCGRPQEFFTDWKAKRQFRRLLTYATSRWGHSPALLSWELVNEMDLAKFDSPEDVVAWSREMAGVLKSSDVHNHLVTTSTTNTAFARELWSDSRIDFVSVHAYGTDVGPLVRRYLSPFSYLPKPVLMAEFGGGTEPEDDIPDKDGARLQASLWLTACSPSCGAALPWWWDTYIEARGLYPVLASARRFMEGEDRRGRFGESVRKEYAGGVEVSGVMDAQGARLYVHRPEWTKNPEARGAQVLEAALKIELTGINDGEYRINVWDAKAGKSLVIKEAKASGGSLSFELDRSASELGLKVDRIQSVAPGLK